ncbi:MAG: hypothetical protein KJ630_14790 [Proteobacteria bacterium]|nr:hypothetical protein [Pseudomonadota bacterium]
MLDDLQKLVDGFDHGQLEALQSLVLEIASVKSGKFTGVTTIEMHSTQGSIGDVYSSGKKKIRSARGRKVRSSGLSY